MKYKWTVETHFWGNTFGEESVQLYTMCSLLHEDGDEI